MYGQYWGYELLTSVNDLHLVDEKKDLLALSKEARCWALRTRPLKMIYKLTKTRYMLMKTNKFPFAFYYELPIFVFFLNFW